MSAVPRPDAFDPRLVLRIYVWVFVELGLLCAGLGAFWLGAADVDPLLNTAVRMSGWTMIAASCCAWGLDGADTRAKRRRGLGWFALAHAVLALGATHALVSASRAGLIDRAAAGAAGGLIAALAIFLWYAWSTTEGEGDARNVFVVWGPRDRGPAITQYAEEPNGGTHASVRAVARQEERNRLARDLHDSVKQQVFVMHTAAATAEARLASDPVGTRMAIAQIRSSAREAMTELEAMLDQLRAEPLELTSLVGALRKQAEAFEFRSGIPVTITLGELPTHDRLPTGAAEAAFRVAQEALANVARHARATAVTLSLMPRDESIELTVCDNGTGFDVNRPPSGMGLANMRSRAVETGGALRLSSTAGETAVTLSVPLVALTLQKYRRDAARRAIISTMWLAVIIALASWRGLSMLVWVFLVIATIAIGRSVFVYAKTRNAVNV